MVKTALMMSSTPKDKETEEKDAVGGTPLDAAQTPVAGSTPKPAEVSVASPLMIIQLSKNPSVHTAFAQKPNESKAFRRSL